MHHTDHDFWIWKNNNNNNNIDRLREPVSQRTHRLLILPCVDVQCAVECDTETWTRKRLKELRPQGWTYWLQPALLHHFSPTIWKASKGQLSCNNVLTNNTKALVYGQTQEEGLVRVQDSGTMGSILRKNTFELSSSLTDDDRTSDRTLILEGTMARGRPLCYSLPLSHCSWAICPVWLVMLRMQRWATRPRAYEEEREEVHAISTYAGDGLCFLMFYVGETTWFSFISAHHCSRTRRHPRS